MSIYKKDNHVKKQKLQIQNSRIIRLAEKSTVRLTAKNYRLSVC